MNWPVCGRRLMGFGRHELRDIIFTQWVNSPLYGLSRHKRDTYKGGGKQKELICFIVNPIMHFLASFKSDLPFFGSVAMGWSVCIKCEILKKAGIAF